MDPERLGEAPDDVVDEGEAPGFLARGFLIVLVVSFLRVFLRLRFAVPGRRAACLRRARRGRQVRALKRPEEKRREPRVLLDGAGRTVAGLAFRDVANFVNFPGTAGVVPNPQRVILDDLFGFGPLLRGQVVGLCQEAVKSLQRPPVRVLRLGCPRFACYDDLHGPFRARDRLFQADHSIAFQHALHLINLAHVHHLRVIVGAGSRAPWPQGLWLGRSAAGDIL